MFGSLGSTHARVAEELSAFLTLSSGNICAFPFPRSLRGSGSIGGWFELRRLPTKGTLSADAEPAERALKGGNLARKKHFQHGSLFKRGKRNKVWVARYREPVIGANGETEFVRRSEILGTVADLPTRRDAEMVLSDRLRRINSAEYHPRSCCSFRSFVQEWEAQALPALKYSTQLNYKYFVDTHLLPEFGDVQLRLISRESIQMLVLQKLKTGLSWNTVKRLRTTLGTILGSAECWGYIDDNPVRKTRMPRRGLQPEKPVLTPEQLRPLLDQLPEPSRSIVWLLALTGLRIGEALALHWRDVDLQGGLLRVSQSVYEGHFDEPKTRASKRTVPLSVKAVEILDRLRPERVDTDALIFSSKRGTPLCRRNLLNRQVLPLCKELKIPRTTWHPLRHACATLLDVVGTPRGTVTALVGHSSARMTEHYVHSVDAVARQAVQKVEDLLTGPKRTQVEEISKLGSTLIQ
jgi:integrase